MNQTHLTAIIVWVAGLFSSVMSFFPMVPTVGQPYILGFGALLTVAGILLHIQGLHVDLQGHKIVINGQVAALIQQIEGVLDLEPGDLTTAATAASVVAPVTTPAPVPAPPLPTAPKA